MSGSYDSENEIKEYILQALFNFNASQNDELENSIARYGVYRPLSFFATFYIQCFGEYADSPETLFMAAVDLVENYLSHRTTESVKDPILETYIFNLYNFCRIYSDEDQKEYFFPHNIIETELRVQEKFVKYKPIALSAEESERTTGSPLLAPQRMLKKEEFKHAKNSAFKQNSEPSNSDLNTSRRLFASPGPDYATDSILPTFVGKNLEQQQNLTAAMNVARNSIALLNDCFELFPDEEKLSSSGDTSEEENHSSSEDTPKVNPDLSDEEDNNSNATGRRKKHR